MAKKPKRIWTRKDVLTVARNIGLPGAQLLPMLEEERTLKAIRAVKMNLRQGNQVQGVLLSTIQCEEMTRLMNQLWSPPTMVMKERYCGR